MVFQFSLKSFHPSLLQRAYKQLTHICENSDMTLSSPSYLPKKTHRFTVLRSPHVNKKSREQFELSRFKIRCTALSSSKVSDSFFHVLQSTPFQGVEVQVQTSSWTSLRKEGLEPSGA